MKRINLAYPFESIQGKQGIKQDLRYAENDNKAYASPEGKVNYARNYKPVMVAARVARTGLNYFAIKTKAATKNTAAWRMVAALMGAVSAIYGWVIKQVNLMAQLGLQYTAAVTLGYEGTFHKWLCAAIRESLAAKSATIQVVGPTATITLGNNPFSSAAEAITIASKVLVKFWNQLCPNGISFKIDSTTAIAITGYTFMDLAAARPTSSAPIPEPKRIDVVGLWYDDQKRQEDDKTRVRHGDQYLADADGYAVYVETIGSSTPITAGAQFFIVDEEPPYRV